MDIEAGVEVQVVTATGERRSMRALRGPEAGRDFAVLWVCTEEEYASGHARGVPWPLDAVEELVDRSA